MRDVTPQKFGCATMASCPALYQTEDGDITIGKIIAPHDLPEEIRQRVGPGECAVWTPKGMLKPGDAA